MSTILGGLSTEERQFLVDQSLSEEDVFDGRALTREKCAAEAKRLNMPLVIGSPCAKGGHRLRTRAGHCAQCNPANLGYQARHTEKSAVYVAYSAVNKISKIGVSNEIEIRESKINRDGYAGATDWEVLFSIVVNEAGRVETAAQVKLARYLINTIYQKDRSKDQMSKEAFACGPLRAVNEVVDVIEKFSLAHETPYVSSKLKRLTN